MGRQVNFFMHPDGIPEFEETVKKTGQEIMFIGDESSTKEPHLLKTLAILPEEMGKVSLIAYITKKDFFQMIKSRFVERQNYWSIDEQESPVIEFIRSYFDGKILRRGRLYFQTGYYDSNDNWVEQPKSFLTWADSVLRWIRNHYVKDPATGDYASPAAIQWQKTSGGEFVTM